MSNPAVDPLDMAADRIIRLAENGFNEKNSVRKLSILTPEQAAAVSDDRIDELIAHEGKKYAKHNPWDIRDKRLAQFIGPIEDEEEELNIDHEDESASRHHQRIADPDVTARILGIKVRGSESDTSGDN